RHVARPEPGSTRREDERRATREVDDRRRDLVGLVRDDAPLDVVAVRAKELVQQVAAGVADRAARHAVGDRQHCSLHPFAFSSSSTSNVIVLSTAFAMSYTVSAATDAAVSASISTPVCAVVSADATISTPRSSTRVSTSTCVNGSG